MPYHEIALPVSADEVELKHRGERFSLTVDTDTFDRTGEDGDIVILPLNGGDEYIGESVEGQWHRGWDANISNFTATVDSGTLKLTGYGVPATYGNGWIKNYHPIPLMDELELTVSMEVPTDVAPASNEVFGYRFLLCQDKNESNPLDDNNSIQIVYEVTTSGLKLIIYKRIDAVSTTLASGYNYQMDTTYNTGNLEGTIWRLVFDGKAGTEGAQLHIYLKQSDTIANAENATENEIEGSPFDLSDLAFDVAYPAHVLRTECATIFGSYGSANAAESTYLRVSYPESCRVCHNITTSDYGDGQVEVWDHDPDLEFDGVPVGQRVYDKDHYFDNPIYVRNGLIQIEIPYTPTLDDIKLYYYEAGSGYTDYTYMFYPYLSTSAKGLHYSVFREIQYLSPEKVIIRFSYLDTATDNEDYYMDCLLTVKRGSYSFEFLVNEVYPKEDSLYYWYPRTSEGRFGYVGDDKLADDDIGLGATNTTMSDNFLIQFDNANEAVLSSYFTNKEPTSYFYAHESGYVMAQYIDADDVGDYKLWISLVPFSLIANTFAEAENEVYSNAASEFIDSDQQGFDQDRGDTYDDDGVTEAQPDGSPTIIYDDNEALWVAGGGATCSEETTIVKHDLSSLKIVTAGAVGTASYDMGAGNGVDYSGRDYFGFWWYGANSSDTLLFRLYDDGGGGAYFQVTWVDDWTGWRWLCFKLTDFADNGGCDWTDIRTHQYASLADGYTWYLDNLLHYDGTWEETINCVVTINDSDDNSVNNYATAINPSSAAWTVSFCYPLDPEPILNFDYLKLYLHKENATPNTINLYFYDADGDRVYKNVSLTQTETEYSIALPHSSSDLQGWTETGTYRFDDPIDHFAIGWTASNAGDIVYVDGLHLYIDTTTSRARGSTLSGSSGVVLDQQNEYADYILNAGTDLPAGVYCAVFRSWGNAVASAVIYDIDNVTDSQQRNVENQTMTATTEDGWGYYFNFFYISDSDVSGTNQFRFRVYKNSPQDTIIVDYFLLIPISDGMNWSQDLAHAVMRNANQHPRLCER